MPWSGRSHRHRPDHRKGAGLATQVRLLATASAVGRSEFKPSSQHRLAFQAALRPASPYSPYQGRIPVYNGTYPLERVLADALPLGQGPHYQCFSPRTVRRSAMRKFNLLVVAALLSLTTFLVLSLPTSARADEPAYHRHHRHWHHAHWRYYHHAVYGDPCWVAHPAWRYSGWHWLWYNTCS
jgi:hypothetical protein